MIVPIRTEPQADYFLLGPHFEQYPATEAGLEQLTRAWYAYNPDKLTETTMTEDTPRFQNAPASLSDELEIARLENEEDQNEAFITRTEASAFADSCRGWLYLAGSIFLLASAYTVFRLGVGVSLVLR